MENLRKYLNECPISLGLDVDAKTSMVIALQIETGTIEYEGRLPHSEDSWRKFIARFGSTPLWACYEAGVTGFGLCRMLRRLGVDCRVVAPAAVPKPAINRQIKNDRRDALMLAHLYINRPHSFVRVPTEQQEADRQLVRTRYQLVKDKTRLMARIKMLLHCYSIQAPDGKGMSRWCGNWRRWLKGVECQQPVRFALDILIAELECIEGLIKNANNAITILSKTKHYSDRCERLMQIPGVGRLTAMTFLLEVYRPQDFPTSGSLASHLGLTTCEYSSGGTVRRGHITHWGPAHLRKLLVEAAWVWMRYDPNARQRYQSIRFGKERKIAIVAMARRLAIAMWAMTVKEEDYNYRWFEQLEAA